MKNVKVSLPTTAIVEAFVETVGKLGGDFELISENYILDARSLMGIFSLDRSKPITLKVYKDSPETLEALEPFIAS